MQWQKQSPTRDEADAWYENQIKTRLAAMDANDMLYAFNASRNYDPSPKLETITAPVLAINSADDQVNPPELGLMETAHAARKEGSVHPHSDERPDARPRHAFAADRVGRLREGVPRQPPADALTGADRRG